MTKTKPNGSIDIFDIDPVAACDAGADLELKHPASDRPLGIFMRIVGSRGKDFEAYARKKVKAQQIEAFEAKSDTKSAEERAEATVQKVFSRQETIDNAATCLVGWWRFADLEKREGRVETITFAGEELAFSKEAGRKVITERTWIADQIDAGAGNLKTFMPG